MVFHLQHCSLHVGHLLLPKATFESARGGLLNWNSVSKAEFHLLAAFLVDREEIVRRTTGPAISVNPKP